MAVDAVVEEVATNLEEAAAVTRRFNAAGVPFLLGGLLIGGACGFLLGKRWNRERIKAELYVESEVELQKLREELRDFYAERDAKNSGTVIVAEPKPDVDVIVKEKGYAEGGVPLDVHERMVKPPVPLHHSTRASRFSSPEKPYVINQALYMQNTNPNYIQIALTFYAQDEVMCDDANSVVDDMELMVGRDNLRFGEGADDPDVVYVRNDVRKLEMEICRVDKSYEVDILGEDGDHDAEGS